MGGFAGLFNLDASPVNQELLQKMMAVTRVRRGGEKIGNFVDTQIGMGQCQFYTTEESQWEDQPFSDESGSLCIVSDGRVDNREALINQCAINAKERIVTDVELILAAYKWWGADCVKRIIGDYAFAIWDKKQQRLFCARDYAGMRPLYYALVDRTLIFGSTIAQFYEHPRISRQLNDEYMADFLLNPVTGSLNSPGTAIKGVKRLPPACYMWVDQSGISEPVEYWSTAGIKEILYSDPDDYADGFREVFREAVKCRIRNNAPVASELSGGLDSSSIVSMAADIYQSGEMPNNGLITLSKGFDVFTEADEASYQQSVIQKYNLINRRIPTDDRLFMQSTESYPCPDEPYGVYLACHEHYLTPEAARDFGATVLFSGIGGDEIMQGSALYIADLLRDGKFRKLRGELSKWARAPNMSYLYALSEFGIKPHIPYFMQPFVGAIIRKPLEFWNHIGVEDTGPMIPEWLDERFAREQSVTQRIRHLIPDRDCHKKSLRLEYRYLRESNSCQAVQIVYCPLNIEIRQPFFDKRLVEYVMGVPMHHRITVDAKGRIVRKLLIRNGMKGILPDMIRNRLSQPNLGRHAMKGLKRALPELIMQLDQDAVEVVKRGYINRERFREVLSRWILGDWAKIGNVVNTLSLELWLRRYTNK